MSKQNPNDPNVLELDKILYPYSFVVDYNGENNDEYYSSIQTMSRYMDIKQDLQPREMSLLEYVFQDLQTLQEKILKLEEEIKILKAK